MSAPFDTAPPRRVEQWSDGSVVGDANPLPVQVTASAITVSSVNSSTIALAAGATFTGTYEDVLSFQQSGVNVFVRPNVLISGDASDAKGSLFIDLNDSNSGSAVTQIPYVVRVPGLFVPQVPITVRRFFRVRYLNDGGVAAIAALGITETAGTPTTQTQFALTVLHYPLATKELLRTLDQGLSGSDPATVTLAVTSGKNPDGTILKAPLGGSFTLSPATSTLGAGGVYLSDAIDTEQFPTIRLLVASDVVSADLGISFEWSNTSAFTVTQALRQFTFSSGYLTPGRLIETRTRAHYFRIRYTNGGSSQGRFFLHLRLNPMPLSSDPPAASSARTAQQAATTAAVLLATSLPNRRTLRLHCLSTSARSLFYGFTSGVATGSGDELAAGASVDLDIDTAVPVYIICTSTAGAGVTCSFTEIGD